MDTRTATATIDAAQVAQYQADGFLVGRDAFGSDRIAELEAEADRLRSRLDLIDPNNLRCRWQDHVTIREWRFSTGSSGDSEIAGSLSLEAALRTPAVWVFAGETSLFGLVSSGLGLFNEAVLAERGFHRPRRPVRGGGHSGRCTSAAFRARPRC